MTLSFWRYIHLALALFSSLFLILASLTGTILAVDAIQEKVPPYKVENFSELNLGKTLDVLKKDYSEITQLSIDHNQFVTLQAIDNDGNDINAYINPRTGKVLGNPIKKSEFINWTTALHRSLFLKESGRLFVGVISLALTIIAITGFVLVVKRQKGLWNYFSKIIKEHSEQYYHVLCGRLAIIPIIIIAISGTYLTLEKFNFFLGNDQKIEFALDSGTKIETKTSYFKNTLLQDIEKIEFPFSDDPEEFFIVTTKNGELEIDQFTGAILKDKAHPLVKVLATISLDLHTGRTNILWAIVLGIASLSILYFIYSGFAMTLRRRSSRFKNKYNHKESENIILVGTENGSTLRFANAILTQLNSEGKKTHITQLNDYQHYPKAKNLIILTATHGLGDPPFNATKFLNLATNLPQSNEIHFSVVGFGSEDYPDFCGYAKKIDSFLENQYWSKRILPLHTVNNKSVTEFINWIQQWNDKTGSNLATTPSLYNQVPKGLKKFVVKEKTLISLHDQTFIITLRPKRNLKVKSGDLLAIYPLDNTIERLYSIGVQNNQIQLVVKLHTLGLGSGYLYKLEVGSEFKARIVANPGFYLPKTNSTVALISNGTGIAPFLGMISENDHKQAIHLFAGFRKETKITLNYQSFANDMISTKKLQDFQIAYSREQNKCYVTDLVEKDADFFMQLLANNGYVMICGSIAMQQDIEKALDILCKNNLKEPLSTYKENGQILSDCY